MASCILHIANVYTRQEQYDKALQKYAEALRLGEDLDEKENLYAFVYGNLSNLYSMQGKIEQALDFGRRSYALRKAVARPEEQATSYVRLLMMKSWCKRSQFMHSICMLQSTGE